MPRHGTLKTTGAPKASVHGPGAVHTVVGPISYPKSEVDHISAALFRDPVRGEPPGSPPDGTWLR